MRKRHNKKEGSRHTIRVAGMPSHDFGSEKLTH